MKNQNWTYKKLGEISSFRRGLTYSKKDEVSSSTKQVLRANNIELDTHTLNFEDIKCIDENFDIAEDKKLKANTIFICMSSGSMQHLGKVAFVDRDYDYAFGGFMGLIVPNADEIHSKYLFYSFLSSRFQTIIHKEGKGININNLKFSDLSDFSIPVPPLPTQRAIVAELDTLNEILDKKRQQLKELDTLAQSIFYDMFGDPVENEKGWEVKKMGEVCDSVSYGTSSPACENGKYKYLRMNNLTYSGYIDLSNVKTINLPDESYEKYVVRKDDILFNRTNSRELVGKTALFNLDEEMIIAGYIIRVRVHQHEVLPVFIVKYMNTPFIKDYLYNLCKGAVNQANINSKELQNIPLYVPPLFLQQSFARKVEAIEKQKELINTSIKEVETLLNATMDKYFG